MTMYNSKFYKLNGKDEKEEICYTQKVALNLPIYTDSVEYKNSEIELTEEHEEKAKKFFIPYLLGEKLPERPKCGFYFDNEDFVAFKGIGKEMSLFFHLLIVPTIKHGYNSNDKITLRSVRDIKKEHIPLLLGMKNEFNKFIRRNRKWFLTVYNFTNMEQNWMKEEQFQFGFHWPPTIGYLHMHAMVGPVTKHGESMKDRWVSLDNVIENLKN
jgi:hypothetical protein